MSKRFLAAVVTALSIACAGPLLAKEQANRASPEKWTAPRTADGHPDLQGVWTMATFTPLERPASLAGKEFFTEEEAAELSRLLTADGVDPLARTALAADEDQRRERVRQSKENIHYDNAIWLTEKRSKGLSTTRTSLIIEPPDGRIPPLTPEARRRESDRARMSSFLMENIAKQAFDSHETRTLQERCLVWRHEGPPMLPPSYNDRIQILQTPGYVAIHQEMSNNAVRIIPMGEHPHLSDAIRQWPGDSIGRWEGDTLVVDTTNFTPKTHFQGSGEALHVIERFTRVNAETIRYVFTVDDPSSWTKPWSAEIPMTKAEGLLYEYACHGGNHDLANILGIARNVEAAAAGANKTSR